MVEVGIFTTATMSCDCSMTSFFSLPVTYKPMVDTTLNLWTPFLRDTPAPSAPMSFTMLTSLLAVVSTSVPPASLTGLALSRGRGHALTADRRTCSTWRIRQ